MQHLTEPTPIEIDHAPDRGAGPPESARSFRKPSLSENRPVEPLGPAGSSKTPWGVLAHLVQRPVAGAAQVHRGGDNAPEYLAELQLAADGEHRVEQFPRDGPWWRRALAAAGRSGPSRSPGACAGRKRALRLRPTAAARSPRSPSGARTGRRPVLRTSGTPTGVDRTDEK